MFVLKNHQAPELSEVNSYAVAEKYSLSDDSIILFTDEKHIYRHRDYTA